MNNSLVDNRLFGHVVCLCIDGSEPSNVQDAIMKVDHYRYSSSREKLAFFTPDEMAFTSKWRNPTPEELRVWLRKHGNFKCHLELHTRTIRGHECITFRGTSERFFWAEVMTHRNSRNASSARAIPYKRMKQWILNDPAMPIHFGSNRAGMQSGDQIADVDGCERELLELLDFVYERMDGIVTRYDVHKEIINRYSEPWAWINWVASFSRPAFHNMLHLRCTPFANPTYQRLASTMARQYKASTPIELHKDEWHIPMISDMWDYKVSGPPRHGYLSEQELASLLTWSTARSAWTSYQTVEEKIATYEEAVVRHDGCVKLLHATPLEHQNRARNDDDRNGGTMPGYDQYRHMVPNESCADFDFDKFEELYKGRDFIIP